jgi:hypothetical protein
MGFEWVLGIHHRSSLETVNKFGGLYKDQGKPGDAEAMYQRALMSFERVLGLDYKSTLETVNHLGDLYKDQGKPTDVPKNSRGGFENH